MLQRPSNLIESGIARHVETENEVIGVLNSRASYSELLDCVQAAKRLGAWNLRRMAAERLVDGLNVVGRRSRVDIEMAANNIVFSIFAEAKDTDSLNTCAIKCDNYLSGFEKKYPNLGEINKRLDAAFKPLVDNLLILLTDDDVRSLIQISSILRRLERSDLAITFSRRALSQDKVNTVAMTTLGAALIDVLENQEALDVLTKSLELNPKSVKAMLATSRCHQEMGHFDKSISIAKTAFGLQPESLPTAHRLISAAVASKDSQAYKDAASVILSNPKSSITDERWVQVLAGLVFCELGNFSQARKIYDDIAKSKPTGVIGKKLWQLKLRLNSAPKMSCEV
jgi:tetratricopeptide (TPR) repeat protein